VAIGYFRNFMSMRDDPIPEHPGMNVIYDGVADPGTTSPCLGELGSLLAAAGGFGWEASSSEIKPKVLD